MSAKQQTARPRKRRRTFQEVYEMGMLDGALEILWHEDYDLDDAVYLVYEYVLFHLSEDEVRQRVTRWYEAVAL